ncbi:MAG: nucleoside triphosphate pyrophosphohydrolase family protein [Parcubacteria group bacterium]|nr:nucleoside triphosphate pyrophosphohydrolase family protein [Parcubacteria group bacterium]
MDFKEYQKQSRKTAIYPNIDNNFVYPMIGLASEVGEVSGKVKKIIRDNNGVASEEKKIEIEKELGDVLWYVSQLASEFDLSLDNIAEKNIEKLLSRLERGKLKGSGDNR